MRKWVIENEREIEDKQRRKCFVKTIENWKSANLCEISARKWSTSQYLNKVCTGQLLKATNCCSGQGTSVLITIANFSPKIPCMNGNRRQPGHNCYLMNASEFTKRVSDDFDFEIKGKCTKFLQFLQQNICCAICNDWDYLPPLIIKRN